MLDNSVTYADIHQRSIPNGIVVPQEIGVDLIHNIWSDFKEDDNIRWMHPPGKILVYTGRPRFVKLSLRPFAINLYNNLKEEGNLIIELNNSSSINVPIKREIITEIVLQLRRDFNIISLELSARNFMPNEVLPYSKDPHSLSVAFYPIEIIPIALLK